MANNTIYIAAAGAGKTTLIIRKAIELYKSGLLEGKKVLIITYTDNNQNNIRQKFLDEYGLVPKNIVILGWFTFLLVYWIRPFKGTVIEQLYNRHIGMSFVEGISGTKTLPNGQIITTYHNNAEKFLDSSQTHLYSDKMAEFAYKCDDVYNHSAEGGLKYNDPDVGIKWPMGDLKIEDLITSEKDAKWPSLKELKNTNLFKNL